MKMQPRFDDRARRVLFAGLDEARRLGTNLVGTEHLLLGLLTLGDGPAADILQHLGISRERLIRGVEEQATVVPGELNEVSKVTSVPGRGPGAETRKTGWVWAGQMDDRCRQSIRFAREQAEELGDDRVG